MNVLITGATGFIGQRVVMRLQAGGHKVHALTRDPAKASECLPGVELHQWWAGSPVAPTLLDQVDAIVNLAGESVNGRWSTSKKAEIRDSRVQATRAIVEAIEAAGAPKVLVNASAVGVYGDRGDSLLTETAGPGAGFLKDVVLAWEVEARKAERTGSRVALLRFGIVLGAEGGAMQKLLPLAKLGVSGPLGSGKQWWPWVHVDDLTRAIEMALLRDLRGVFNVTAPCPVPQKEFASVLGKAVGRPALLPAPAFALRLIQGEFADELLFSKRVLPQRLLDEGFQFDYPELEGALSQLLGRGIKVENVPAHA
jgi:uncharacterized protein (TIGR01777 family)